MPPGQPSPLGYAASHIYHTQQASLMAAAPVGVYPICTYTNTEEYSIGYFYNKAE